MRNYIILNNKDSRDITGLLIQELPPISKPKMRTSVEEIDGRDGDITTKLGYEAYDKEISIGLYGNYGIDKVIDYFNSEGTVIFSNEPDKYYKYSITEKIDFERLVRFRTATVTLHCQPFKFPVSEAKIEENATDVTGTGTNITLNNTEEGATFTELTLSGQTKQKTLHGKNLLNTLAAHTAGQTVTRNGVSCTYLVDGGIHIKGTATAQADFPISKGSFGVGAQGPANILGKDWAGKTFTISGSNFNGGNMHVGFFNNGSPVSDIATDRTWTAPSSTEANGLYVYIAVPKTGQTIDRTIYPQIEKGSTATAYEPYCGGTASPNPDYPQKIQTVTGECSVKVSGGNGQSQSFPLSLGSLELCKIGDYEDSIFEKDGKWYKKAMVGKTTFTGTEPITTSRDIWIATIPTVPFFFTAYLDNTKYQQRTYDAVGTHFFKCTGIDNMLYHDTRNLFAMYNTQNYGSIWMNVPGVTDRNQAKTWLTDNKPTFYAALATPTTTEITDATLVAQLNALRKAKTYAGTTTIASTGSLAPVIYVKTVAMKNPSYTIHNAGNTYSKPKLTIWGIGDISVYLDGKQLFKIEMGEDTGHITIDTDLMEAYKDTTNQLKNRLVTGDYDNFRLPAGDSKLSFNGTIQGYKIENYTRWI